MLKVFSVLYKVILGFFLLCSVATAASAATAVDWLASQQDPYGAYTVPIDIATPYQSTAETLRAFQAAGQIAQVGIPAALQFVNAETLHSTENLSRKIIANLQAGNSVSALVTELITLQNEDGGFGELVGYSSTVLDTAHALEALTLAGQPIAQPVGSAVGYLTRAQLVGGAG